MRAVAVISWLLCYCLLPQVVSGHAFVLCLLLVCVTLSICLFVCLFLYFFFVCLFVCPSFYVCLYFVCSCLPFLLLLLFLLFLLLSPGLFSLWYLQTGVPQTKHSPPHFSPKSTLALWQSQPGIEKPFSQTAFGKMVPGLSILCFRCGQMQLSSFLQILECS